MLIQRYLVCSRTDMTPEPDVGWPGENVEVVLYADHLARVAELTEALTWIIDHLASARYRDIMDKAQSALDQREG